SALMSRWWPLTSALMPATDFWCFFSARRSRASFLAARVKEWCAAAMSFAAGGFSAFRALVLADVLAFRALVLAGRLAFRALVLVDLLTFRAPVLVDLLTFFVPVVLAIEVLSGRRNPRGRIRVARGAPLTVDTQCSHPAAHLIAPGPARARTLGLAVRMGPETCPPG
ncbi:MAG TPA: hypothetical protein VGP33_07340, partial [Chloroflexota bacterium]|nr:hypothetical protein [Chloroflexota bacterium]